MKDITKVIERFKKDCIKFNIDIPEVHTMEEVINFLAEQITMVGSDASRKLFKKYAKYEAGYVKTAMPMFYNLIKDDVEKMEIKARTKAGLSEEEAAAEFERNKKLQEIKENRIIGYARVSTKDQNLDRQLKALEEAGCDVIFQEKLTGKDTDRIEYKTMMNSVKSGDTIVISELTRIARSTTDLFKIMAELDEKGVSLKSLKESWLDTTTAHGRLMFTIMAGLSQFERELMLERQSEGIEVAKENGVKFGVKLSEKADLDLAIALVKEGKYTTTQIANMCHISRTTLWRRCKDLGLL